MTEQEAIEIIDLICKELYKPKKVQEALDTAISALKEVQQYRKIGTIEQVRNQKDNLDTAYKIISDYESCGTVEECREARGKQEPRIPKFIHMMGEYNARFKCPVCEHRFIYDCTNIEPFFCKKCGQALRMENEDD